MSQRPNEGEFWKHCESGICSQLEMYKGTGRRFIVRTYHKGVERKWCPTCIRIRGESQAILELARNMFRDSLLAILKSKDKVQAVYNQADQWNIEL